MSNNMTQKLIIEIDSANPPEKYLRLAMTNALASRLHKEIAVKITDRSDKYLNSYMPPVFMDQNEHFPVIFISGGYLPKEGKKNSYFNGRGLWTTFHSSGITNSIDAAVQYIKEFFDKHKKTWGAQLGDDYNNYFNHFNGSVGLGYKLHIYAGVFRSGWASPSLICITASDFTINNIQTFN